MGVYMRYGRVPTTTNVVVHSSMHGSRERTRTEGKGFARLLRGIKADKFNRVLFVRAAPARDRSRASSSLSSFLTLSFVISETTFNTGCQSRSG